MPVKRSSSGFKKSKILAPNANHVVSDLLPSTGALIEADRRLNLTGVTDVVFTRTGLFRPIEKGDLYLLGRVVSAATGPSDEPYEIISVAVLE